MNPETLGGYERGDTEPDVAFLQMYRARFGINLDWLISGDGDMFLDQVLNTVVQKFSPTYQPRPQVDPDILARVADVVRRAYEDAGLRTSANSDIRPLARFYNDFISEQGVNVADEAELELALSQLRSRLTKMFAKAKKKPGTGKRSASS